MRKSHGPGLAVTLGLAAVTAVTAIASPTAVAGTTPGTASAGTADTCPSVVALVARGSEENDVYAPSPANGHSNGYEGETLHRFLTYATAVHPDLFGSDEPTGQGPEEGLGERAVLALDADHYPARFPVGEPGEVPDPATLAGGVGMFIDSMAQGLPGGVRMVEQYESSTGCRPDYVGLGYSQGVAALAPVQHRLASEGRLRGAVYLGNPFHRVPDLIGGGAMSTVPVHSYCLDDDFVCDPGPRSALLAVQDDEGAGAHDSYFAGAATDPSTAGVQERAAADVFAGLIR
ncbi:hypothetical protein [Corynebacterium kalidii]